MSGDRKIRGCRRRNWSGSAAPCIRDRRDAASTIAIRFSYRADRWDWNGEHRGLRPFGNTLNVRSGREAGVIRTRMVGVARRIQQLRVGSEASVAYEFLLSLVGYLQPHPRTT